MPRSALAPLLAVEGVWFCSLQKDQKPAEGDGAPLPIADWTAELRDFADTAALIASLDLVVTIDTAVAHLAGALGKPVWVLLPFVAEWRWLSDRTDSPWYPTLKLFRQDAPGDWSGPVARILRELSLIRDGRA